MGNKVTLIVVFSAILVLFFGMTLFDDAQAMKSKGNSLTEVSSKQVCGNFLCDEPMSIAEKIRLYLQQLSGSESTVLQQAIDPRLMIKDQGLRVGIQESKERQTPKTDFGAMMKKGLSKSADTVLKSANIAAPFIPGGSVVSAAVSGMATMDVPTESGTQKIFVFAPEGLDINALVQWVLRESYMGNLEDMKYYAEKVRYYNDVKKGMRESLTEIRQYQSEYAPIESEEIYPDEYGRIKVKFPWILEELDYDPSKPVVLKGVASSDSYGVLIINKNDESGRHLLKILEIQLQDEIAKAEADRETLRNDRQMTSTQFENANQKATQYINMLSSVLKTMQEMNQGIIQNLR